MLALLRTLYNKADSIGYNGVNPCRGVKAYREEKRDRFLLPEEVPAFFDALAKEDELFQDYFLLLILTGARRSNVCSMKWSDVRLDAGQWRIPETKNNEPQIIHLVPKAIEILRRRWNEREDHPFVFPGGRKNRNDHFKDPKAAWDRIRERGGLRDLRIHDLRRTMGSWLAIGGASLVQIGKALGHRSQQSTVVYARLTEKSVAEHVNNATGAILAASTVKK